MREDRSSLGIHHLFERQVARTPNNVALVIQKQSLTYAQVNQKANQLAHALRLLGVGIECVVGLCLRRSPEAIVALLGILKAGGAYVPIDPDFPEARKEYILNDAGCSVLITDSALQQTLPTFHATILQLDDEWISHQRSDNPNLPLAPDALMYILYTSGSTGVPKGVCGIHSATINRCQWMWQQYPFAPNEVCCHKTTLNFVDSVWEIFGPLLQGIKLVILPHSANANPQEMIRLLASAKVTRIVLVPSLLQMLLTEQPDLEKTLPDLKLWTVSGEPLPTHLLHSFRAGVPHGVLLNLYGSTEVAGDVTWAEFAAEALDEREDLKYGVQIGRPILNAEVYIVGEQGQLVTSGEIGELWVGGPVLARGYHKKPQETQARFIANPFSDKGTLFKTGDLVRLGNNGLLYYVGRVDNQVKLRGIRIELEEIEKVLALIQPAPSIVIVVLQRRGAGIEQLVAFVTPANLDVQEIKRYALLQLPAYMVPARIVALDQLPLTPNGKVDRHALASLERWELYDRAVGNLPQSESEKLLASIWQEMLHVSPIVCEDDFFALGGNSMLVVAFLSRLKQELGVQLPLSDFLNLPTLGACAAALDHFRQHTCLPKGKVDLKDVAIVPFEERHLAQTVELVSQTFITRGPLESELGVKQEEFTPFAKQVCQNALAARLSYLAIDKISGNILGFCLCEDFADYLAYQFEVQPWMNPVFSLLDALDQSYVKRHGAVRAGEIFHIFVSGSAPQVEGSAIVLALESKVLDLAAALKYQRALTTCTHSVTNYIAQELGFQRIEAIPYDSFEYDNRYVFGTISGPHQEAVLLEKVLSPFKT